jgi:ABC-type transporter Mla maintaining outer membrane lipid asymmetry permease subunit MlaE
MDVMIGLDQGVHLRRHHRAHRLLQGPDVRLGAEGVGRATTEAVVYSSITILITNFFLTLVLGKLVGQL